MLRNGKATVLTLAALCAAGCARSDYMGPRQRQMLWQPTKPQAMAKAERAVDPKILPETYFAAARLFEQQGMIGQAITQYRKTIAVNHKHVAAHHRLGVLLNATGRHDEAAKMLRRAVDLEPDNVIVRNNLGFALMLQQRWEEAEREFRHATRLEPRFVRAHVNLGMVLARLGRFDDALASFRDALPEPDAYYNLGLMFRAQKRYPDAAEAFQHVLALDSEFSAARTQLERIAEHLTPPKTDKVADTGVEETDEGIPTQKDPALEAETATMAATIVPEPVTVTRPKSSAAGRQGAESTARTRRPEVRPGKEIDPCEEERILDEVFGESFAVPEEEPGSAADAEEPVSTVTTEDEAIIPALRLAMKQVHAPILVREAWSAPEFDSYEHVMTMADEVTFATVLVPASTYESQTRDLAMATATEIEPYTEVEQYTEFELIDESVRLTEATADESMITADSVAMMDAFERLVGYFPADVWCWDGIDWEEWETVDVVKLAEAEMMVERTEFAMSTVVPTGGFDAVLRETPARLPVGLDVVVTDEDWVEKIDVAPTGQRVSKAKRPQATGIIVRRRPYAMIARRGNDPATTSVRPVDRQAVLKSLERQLVDVREEIKRRDDVLSDHEFFFPEDEPVVVDGGVGTSGQTAAGTPRPRRETAASRIIVPVIDPDADMSFPVPPIDPVYLETLPDECPSVFDVMPTRFSTPEGGRVLIKNKNKRPAF